MTSKISGQKCLLSQMRNNRCSGTWLQNSFSHIKIPSQEDTTPRDKCHLVAEEATDKWPVVLNWRWIIIIYILSLMVMVLLLNMMTCTLAEPYKCTRVMVFPVSYQLMSSFISSVHNSRSWRNQHSNSSKTPTACSNKLLAASSRKSSRDSHQWLVR